MLKNIPSCISPELISILMRMGHGDELVLADGDFPAETYGKRVIRADGLKIATLLDAILPLFPVDNYVKNPFTMMAPAEECGIIPKAWEEFGEVISKHYQRFSVFDSIERYDFYERAQNAFAIVVTGEPDGNIIIRKGVVNE